MIWTVLRHHAMFDQIASYGALWPCTLYTSSQFCMALCGHPHHTHLVNFAWRFVAAHCTHLVNFAWRFVAVHTVRICSILHDALWPPTVRTCSILHDALWPCTPYASVQFCMALCGHPHRTHLVNFAWRFVAAHTVRICSVLHGALWPPTVRIWSILHGALWPCTLYASGRFCTLLPGCKQTALNFL